MGRMVLVLGGARSGKSDAAEALVESREKVTYIVTAQTMDAETRDRVRLHRRQRPEWRTFEQPIGLRDLVAQIGDSYDAVLIDCIGQYVGNLMLTEDQMSNKTGYVLRELERLCAACVRTKAEVVIVSNEVGSGTVPQNVDLGLFRDVLGRVNMRLAEGAAEVHYIVAGIRQVIKKEEADDQTA